MGYESAKDIDHPYPLSSEEEGAVDEPPPPPLPPPPSGQLAADIAEAQAMNFALVSMEPEVRMLLQDEMNMMSRSPYPPTHTHTPLCAVLCYVSVVVAVTCAARL
eukprot:845935-Pleurochrysis_carterae.AAC.1